MWVGWDKQKMKKKSFDLLGFQLSWCGDGWFALIWFGLGWLGFIFVWSNLVRFGLVWLRFIEKCP